MLTDEQGKLVTEQSHGFRKEFAVLLFGALDHPDFHTWMEKFAKCVYESGARLPGADLAGQPWLQWVRPAC